MARPISEVLVQGRNQGGTEYPPTAERLKAVEDFLDGKKNLSFETTERITPVGPATDVIAPILDAISRGVKRIIIPAWGSWTAQTQQAVITADNVVIQGEYPGGVTITVTSGSGSGYSGAVFSATSRTGLTIENLNFASGTPGFAVLVTKTTKRIQLRNIRTGPICLWWNERGADFAATTSYSSIDKATATRDVLIENCYGDGNVGFMSNGWYVFIEGRFAYDVTIRKCGGSNYYHGVQWWGGWANGFNGEAGTKWLTGERKVDNWLVQDFRGENYTGACVWGSMGTNIRVENCYGKNAADVMYDAEGCRNVVFERCTAVNARHALLAVFFGSKDVKYINCHGEFQADHPWPTDRCLFFGVWNSSVEPDRNLGTKIIGCTFRSEIVDGQGRLPAISTINGPAWDIEVSGCHIENGWIDIGPRNNNARYMDVKNNRVEINLAMTTAHNIIDVGKTQYGEGGTGEVLGVNVDHNVIYVRTTMPAGVSGIRVYQEAGPHQFLHYLDNNRVHAAAGNLYAGILIKNRCPSGGGYNVFAGGNILPQGNTFVVEDFGDFTATGTTGTNTITLNSDFNVTSGAMITGTGIPAGTTISSWNSGTRVATLSQNLTQDMTNTACQVYARKFVRFHRTARNAQTPFGLEAGPFLVLTPSAGSVSAAAEVTETFTLTDTICRNTGVPSDTGTTADFEVFTDSVTALEIRAYQIASNQIRVIYKNHNAGGGASISKPGTLRLVATSRYNVP